MNNLSKRSMLLSFLFAFLLHSLVLAFLWMKPEVLTGGPEVEITKEPVVTQLISAEEFLQYMKKKKIVETEFVEDAVEESEGPVYAGEKRQRVKKQTVSSQSGSVKGGSSLLSPDPLNLKNSGGKIASQNKKAAPTGVLKKGGVTPEKNNRAMSYGSLDGMDVDADFGPLTQLNTDEYRFASFFNRYRRTLYGYWQPTVWKYSSKETLISDTSYMTKLDMHYTKEGKLEKIVLQTSSGKKLLDQAAIDSVKKMGLVQNIPTELYESAGKAVVPITFSFQLVKNPVDFKVGTAPAKGGFFR